MSLIFQEALVALIVAACAFFAFWRLASLRVRLRALDVLAGVAPLRDALWVRTLRVRTLAKQTGCGGCPAATPGVPGGASRNQTSGTARR